MTYKVGVAEAKANFSDLLRRVSAGETIVVEKRGAPVAVLRAYQASDEEAPACWADEILGSARDVPEFEEIMAEVVASRADRPPRPVDLDE